MGLSPITERSMVSLSALHLTASDGFVKTQGSSSVDKDSNDDHSSLALPGMDPVEVFSDSDDDELFRDDSDKDHHHDHDEHHHHQHHHPCLAMRRYYSPQQEVRKSPMQQQQQNGQNHHRRCKSVGFADIEIRTYPVVMGDHPCCAMGCPLALGWEYSQNQPLSVDDYEASRSPRRAREGLKTSWDQRRSMLKEVGVSDGEVKRAERKLHRERSKTKLGSKLCASFFSNAPPPPPPSLSDVQEEHPETEETHQSHN